MALYKYSSFPFLFAYITSGNGRGCPLVVQKKEKVNQTTTKKVQCTIITDKSIAYTRRRNTGMMYAENDTQKVTLNSRRLPLYHRARHLAI